MLRRGPRTHYQLLLWDTRRDHFTPGQWMKGIVKLMDLSPRGDKLIYWAAQYHSSARWLHFPSWRRATRDRSGHSARRAQTD